MKNSEINAFLYFFFFDHRLDITEEHIIMELLWPF